MEDSTVKKDILDLFKKNQIKKGGIIDPNIFHDYVSKFNKKNEIADAIDDLINKGLTLETRSSGKRTLLLTKSGEEFIYV